MKPLAISFAGFLVALASSLLITRPMARRLLERGISGIDVHKRDKPVVAEMGGISFLLASSAGWLVVLGSGCQPSAGLIGSMVCIGLVAAVGAYDDLRGLRQRSKVILTALASVPLLPLLTGPGMTSILLPGAGSVDLGWAYFLVVPLGIAAASNLTNMYAGFNGLEAGVGIVSLASLAAVLALARRPIGMMLLLPFIGGLLGFLRHNAYPAKVFPGDVGTLAIGATLATGAILGKAELPAVVIVLPLLVDFLFKAKLSFSTRSRGDSSLGEDGRLVPAPYPSLVHLVMKTCGWTERRLVAYLCLISLSTGIFAVGLVGMGGAKAGGLALDPGNLWEFFLLGSLLLLAIVLFACCGWFPAARKASREASK